METGEYHGEWWLPESPNSRIRGTMIITHSDLTLETEKSFSGELSTPYFPSHHFIHGAFYNEHLRDDRIVTLRSLQMIGAKSSGSLNKFTYNTDCILEGAFFENDDQLEFKTISMTLDHLDDWLWTSSIDIQHENKKQIVTFESVKQQSFDINDQFDLEIYTATGPKTMHFPLQELTIKQKSHLRLYLSDNHSLSQLQDTVRHLQNFFSFALGNPVRVTSIAGKITPGLISEEKISIPFVDITYLTMTSGLPERRISQFKTHFRHGDVGEKFPGLLKNWFEKKDKLGTVLDLYFKNMYAQGLLATERFMDLSRAIEVYHRRSFPSNIDSQEIHDKRMREIKDAIPKHTSWLEDNLGFSNEKKLQSRLDEIIQRLPSTLGNSDPESIAGFTQMLRQTRNYHTHYGDPGARALVDPDKISRFSQGLKLVLDVIIMNEMGFSDTEICTVSDPLKRALKQNWMKEIVEHCRD